MLESSSSRPRRWPVRSLVASVLLVRWWWWSGFDASSFSAPPYSSSSPVSYYEPVNRSEIDEYLASRRNYRVPEEATTTRSPPATAEIPNHSASFSSVEQHEPLEANTTASSEPSSSRRRRFAYAYVVAGCTDFSCVGYLLNTVVAATILGHHGSEADVVLLVRMAAATTTTPAPARRLPAAHEEWLRKAGVRWAYLPAPREHDSFETATLEKFRVLDLTDYDRVRFFDADLIPLCNLDRDFEDSLAGRLEPFVGKRGSAAPITASDFMVEPGEGRFGDTMDLIHARRNATREWDPAIGWGHAFGPNETWVSGRRSGRAWDFFGAPIDQGILYQLFRFELGNWSDVSKGTHTRWKQTVPPPPTSPGDQAGAAETERHPVPNATLVELSNGGYASRIEQTPRDRIVCFRWKGKHEVYNFHFNGGRTPWRHSVRSDKIPTTPVTPHSEQQEHWFHWLGVANKTLGLELPSAIVQQQQQKGGNPMSYGKGRTQSLLLDPNTEIPRPVALHFEDR